MNNKIPQQQQQQQRGRQYSPFDRFISMIYSVDTKRNYIKALRQFLKFCGFETYEQLLEISDDKKFELISEFLIYLKKEKNVVYSTRNLNFCAIRRFYKSNRVNLNWDHLTFFKGKNEGKVIEDRIYTHDEIVQLLDHADLRMKVVIYMLLSTGMRVGGLAGIKITDMEYIDKYNIYKFKVYSDDINEKYITFCTPECANIIKKYLEWREKKGDTIKPSSPLIYSWKTMIDRRNGASKVMIVNLFDKPLTSKSLQQSMNRLQKKANLIPDEKEESIEQRGKIRYEVMRCHSFRKIFNSTCIKNNMNHYIKEMLMGHKADLKLDRNYYRPRDDQLLEEYITKVANDLTVNPAHRLQKQIQQIEEQNNYQQYIIDKKMKDSEEQIKILTSRLTEYEENAKQYEKAAKEFANIYMIIHELKKDRIKLIQEGREDETTSIDELDTKDFKFEEYVKGRRERMKKERDMIEKIKQKRQLQEKQNK